MNKKVVAVVVTYNRKELLAECIAALMEQSLSVDIIVIDNASTDGTADMVKKITGPVQYYNMQSNLGGAGGFNYGIKKAFEAGYEYIWMMDDDTIPSADALGELLKAAERLKDWGYLVSRAQWTDGKECVMNRPGIICGMEADKYPQTEWATFVSILLNRETIMQVGLPVKDFFVWGDDREYTKRITRCRRAYYVPDSIVIHKMKNNVGSDISVDGHERIERYFYAFRNEYYIACHENNRLRAKLKYYRYVLGSIKAVILHAPDYRLKRIHIILKGMCEGFSFRPQVEMVEAHR